MSGSHDLTKNDEFELDLIECMRQPGRLRLSRRTCGLQYRLAQQKYRKIPNGEFGMVRRMISETCRTCPEGRLCSESLKKQSSCQKKNLRLNSDTKAGAISVQGKSKSDVI